MPSTRSARPTPVNVLCQIHHTSYWCGRGDFGDRSNDGIRTYHLVGDVSGRSHVQVPASAYEGFTAIGHGVVEVLSSFGDITSSGISQKGYLSILQHMRTPPISNAEAQNNSPLCLYTPCSARASSLSTLLRFSRPLSDQGKWATGIRKKELLESAIPARALYLVIISYELVRLGVCIAYQARNAASKPNPPPALMAVASGAPPLLRR